MLTKAQLHELLANPPREAPVLKCVAVGPGLLKTDKCPYCLQTHWHGAVGIGHRAGHCVAPYWLKDREMLARWWEIVGRGYILQRTASP